MKQSAAKTLGVAALGAAFAAAGRRERLRRPGRSRSAPLPGRSPPTTKALARSPGRRRPRRPRRPLGARLGGDAADADRARRRSARRPADRKACPRQRPAARRLSHTGPEATSSGALLARAGGAHPLIGCAPHRRT
ncbi:hypothetical protein [Streptomyces shaanxiensis]